METGRSARDVTLAVLACVVYVACVLVAQATASTFIHLPLGISVAVGAFLTMALAVLASPVGKRLAAPAPEVSVKTLGQKLMTDYVLPLEVMALLLTAAMLGAVIIAMREKEGK